MRKPTNHHYPILEFVGVILAILGFIHIVITIVFFVGAGSVQGPILDQLFGNSLPKFYQDMAFAAHYLVMTTVMIPGFMALAAGELLRLMVNMAADIEYIASQTE